jgi:HK97 family phage major capsid protein
VLSAEPLGPDLYAHLVDTLYSVPAPARRCSRWVMNAEWMGEIRKMTGADGRPLWAPASDDLRLLFGLPVEIRDGGGVPHLEAA